MDVLEVELVSGEDAFSRLLTRVRFAIMDESKDLDAAVSFLGVCELLAMSLEGHST